jgi:hypothetical protein
MDVMNEPIEDDVASVEARMESGQAPRIVQRRKVEVPYQRCVSLSEETSHDGRPIALQRQRTRAQIPSTEMTVHSA